MLVAFHERLSSSCFSVTYCTTTMLAFSCRGVYLLASASASVLNEEQRQHLQYWLSCRIKPHIYDTAGSGHFRREEVV